MLCTSSGTPQAAVAGRADTSAALAAATAVLLARMRTARRGQLTGGTH